MDSICISSSRALRISRHPERLHKALGLKETKSGSTWIAESGNNEALVVGLYAMDILFAQMRRTIYMSDDIWKPLASKPTGLYAFKLDCSDTACDFGVNLVRKPRVLFPYRNSI